MANDQMPSEEQDGGERGNSMRRNHFNDQDRPIQDDIIRRGFKDKYPTQKEQMEQLKDHKPDSN